MANGCDPLVHNLKLICTIHAAGISDHVVVWRYIHYSLFCPRIRLASCISFGMIVTRLPWIAHRLQSSNKPIKCASLASCNAKMADACQLYCRLVKPCWISRTNRAKGSRRINKSVVCWYLRISRSAPSPGRIRRFFFRTGASFGVLEEDEIVPDCRDRPITPEEDPTACRRGPLCLNRTMVIFS